MDIEEENDKSIEKPSVFLTTLSGTTLPPILIEYAPFGCINFFSS